MQKIRKILRAVSEKTVLPTNQPTNQPIITKNTDLIVPRWSRSKNSYTNICLKFLCYAKSITPLFIFLISSKNLLLFF